MKEFVHLLDQLAEFFLEWEMFSDKICIVNQNTFYVYSHNTSCLMWVT